MNQGNERIDLLAVAERLKTLEHSHSRLSARTMALQQVVDVLAWGCWHGPSEVSKRLLESGQKSLATINTWPEELQQEVVNVWNQAYKQLADPDAGASFIGIRPE
ncbi:hypothetical protein EN794_004550 [Mesorhizobium sp. M00.F.Ca.ET.151.01.1.1]|nr:hypothetical protein EN842_05205 [bacterium M00.F.Ca.ET.199.01.1.1]TGT08743.1 hypothetical protein EN820_00390 [bacterium M00.F.Ca.ET.177.01.1.1]TGT66677.1 hypothetical protein EN813_000390 [Mesorhizobium sp. M00.F.Ca.ET.170.01.1.1]TGU15590.1 hypothetical protein EN806_00390 [bacterium M00.F.Ca.ET.163.01.1.1]TGU98316.1 hypothetical protein EN794_004550 [Mesorhizobium sp. M00.F.Ca.ET.151.01.1.1]TGV59982.1 hypothetical protein EN784_05940 [bacterium M00.F.Ca.ET.141.01.1.1]